MRLMHPVLAALLLAAMAGTVPAQNTSLDSLNARLADLDARWNEMVRFKAKLEAPNSVLIYDYVDGMLRVIDRDELSAFVTLAIVRGADAKLLVKRIATSPDVKRRALRALDLMMNEWKAEADQARAEWANAATAPFFLRYTGSLTGQYKLTCRSSDGTVGNFSEGGPAKLEFLGAGRLAGVWGEGVIQGAVDKNGVASGTARGPSFTAQWSGTLTQAPNGGIRGGGGISTPSGSITCSGSWSIP